MFFIWSLPLSCATGMCIKESNWLFKIEVRKFSLLSYCIPLCFPSSSWILSQGGLSQKIRKIRILLKLRRIKENDCPRAILTGKIDMVVTGFMQRNTWLPILLASIILWLQSGKRGWVSNSFCQCDGQKGVVEHVWNSIVMSFLAMNLRFKMVSF